MKTELERFEAKYIPEPNSGCWLWTAARQGGGYGIFYFRRRLMGAHRVSYLLFRGEIPPGLELDHLCCTKFCVNPWHLEAVTKRINILRGESATAKNARKTHCSKGHPLSGDNISEARLRSYGWRQCRTCARAYKQTPEYIAQAKEHWRIYRARGKARET